MDGVSSIRIKTLQLFPGARYGLKQKTARVDFAYDGVIADLAGFDGVLAKLLEELGPDAAKPLPWPPQIADHGADAGIAIAFGCRILELILLMLRLAREPVFEGRVVEASPRQAVLALPWSQEAVLRGTLTMAQQLILHASANGAETGRTRLGQAFAEWLARAQSASLTPVQSRLAGAAYRKDHPIERRKGFLQIGWGANARRLTNTMSDTTSAIAVRTARQKDLANRILAEAGLPVPACARVSTVEDALTAAERIGWPLVVKPANEDGGVAVTTNIRDPELLRRAFAASSAQGQRSVLVEGHIVGDDHRLLVVGTRMLIATKRTPGGVTGDGVRTVVELLEAVNADPRRGQDKHASMLIRIALDDEAQQCLSEQGLGAESVPPAGQFVRLRRAANVSIGGTAEDVTARVHPDNRRLAIRAARVVGLDIAGIDFLCPDISRSWREVGGGICEVNSQPSLRVHWLGDPARDIEGEIVDWRTGGRSTRIPTAAIAGTRDASTMARMLRHIWMAAGTTAGVCTARGMWVGNEIVSERNLAGFHGARMLFNDPLVEAAVIALSPNSLLQFGHPCDRYDVVALHTMQDGDNGESEVHSPEEMAEVVERAASAVVINADDPLRVELGKRAGGRRHILVAGDPTTEPLREHLASGGEGVFTQACNGEPWIVLATGAEQSPLMPLAEASAAMSDSGDLSEYDVMFAVAVAWALGLPAATIRQAVPSFSNKPEGVLP